MLDRSFGLSTADGETVIDGLVSDVTRHKQAEAALLEAHQRMRRLGDNLPDGYVFQLVQGADGVRRFAYVSAGFERIYGITPREVLAEAETWYARVAPEDRADLQAAEERSGRELSVLSTEVRVRTQAGVERWVQLRSSPTRQEDGSTVWDGVALDVTDRRQAEADRLILSKLESTGVLAGGLAHDFNNLLTAILLGVEFARTQVALNEDAQVSLSHAEKAVHAARQLVTQLITFAEGGTPIRRSADLAVLVREAAQVALSGSAAGSRLVLPQDLWAAEVDAAQIAQVLRNLILNAREAMPDGGCVTVSAANVTLAAQSVPTLPAGDFVRVQVIDEGVGIEPEVLPKVFDPYFSTKQRGSKKGMGLGLTICHTVIQKHGGWITVSSTPGRGANFTFYVPAVRERPPAPVTADRALRAGPPAGRARILVMDDEHLVRNAVGQILQQFDYEAHLAADGREAVEMYRENHFDGRPYAVVLLDLTVRDGPGGVEALRQLREINPAVRAVAMSGYSDSEVLKDYARYGFQGALVKPFDGETLQDLLGRLS